MLDPISNSHCRRWTLCFSLCLCGSQHDSEGAEAEGDGESNFVPMMNSEPSWDRLGSSSNYGNCLD